MTPTALRLPLFALVLCTPPLAGQEALPAPGSRVRLQPTGAQDWIVGRLEEGDDETLVLLRDGETTPLAVSRSMIARLEVSRGRRGRTGTGMLLGGLAGALAGGVTVLALCGPDGCIGSGIVLLPLGMAGGALAGGGIGAAIGATIRSERWQAVPLEDPVLGVVPLDRGVGLGVALPVRF